MRTIRIVNYAVNGSGIGHLQRLVAINRWVRRYAAHAGVRAEIYFLTSSEADRLLFAERFASFKLPSKTIVGETGIDKLTYLALAKQWVWHSLGLLRPDLLVVDTFPRGSFGELLSALDLCRKRAFIYRPMKDSVAARVDFQAMLPLYDAILVPESEADAPVRVPPEAATRLHHAGPVMIRERAELLPPEEVRHRLGIAAGRLAVYVSAGGGGDPTAEARLAQICEVLQPDPTLHLVVGAGPLYRGRVLTGERITWLTTQTTAELMAGFDLAISAAGYNTWCELMYAGVPSIFLPQEKVADEQLRRARRAVAVGAAVLAGDDLRAAVDGWRDPAARARAAAAARDLVPRNHARDLAAELLRQVLPGADVDAAEEALGDPVLEASRALAVELEVIIQVMTLLGREHPALAIDLVRDVVEAGIPVPAAVRLLEVLARKLPAARADERAAAARGLLAAFAPFHDWAGAAMLLKNYAIERATTAATFTAEVTAFLGRLATDGGDLYRGLARLAQATDLAAAAVRP